MTFRLKGTPPLAPARWVRRGRLEQRLDVGARGPLTTIVAGPGFGKTTLLAGWVDRRAVWYTIDARDRELDNFVAGLSAAFATSYPDLLYGVTGRRSGQRATEESSLQAAAIASAICESLERAEPEPFVLVFDDVHELDPRSPSAALVEALVRQAPSVLHLVVSSRYPPPFSVQRLRARGGVEQLDADALRLTVDEVGDVVRESLGLGMEELAAAVHEMTAGWPAATALTVAALRNLPPPDRFGAVETIGAAGGPLVSYLTEEVLRQEPAEVRTLLRTVSLFDRFTAGLCTSIGVPGAAVLIEDLRSRGLFVQGPTAEGWFTLHPLIREYIADTSPISAAERKSLSSAAARWFRSDGALREWLRMLELSGDREALVIALSQSGRELLESGLSDVIVRLGELLDPELTAGRIDDVVGEALLMRGDALGARQHFLRAAGGARRLTPRLALGLGRTYHERGEPREAIAVYRRAALGEGQPREVALLWAWMSTSHFNLGDLQAASEAAEASLAAARLSARDDALAAAHGALFLVGLAADLRSADDHYREAVAAARRAGDAIELIRIENNRAGQLCNEARFDEAGAVVDTALRLTELVGWDAARAGVLQNRGEANWELGRLEQAFSDLLEARALYRSLRSARETWALVTLARFHRERGDLALARAAVDEALRVSERAGDVYIQIPGRLERARLIVGEDAETAMALAEASVDAARRLGWHLAFALVGAGWVALAAGDQIRAKELATAATSEAVTARNRSEFAESLVLGSLATAGPGADDRLDEAVAVFTEINNPLRRSLTELAIASTRTGSAARAVTRRAERVLRGMGVRLTPAAAAAGILNALPQRARPPTVVRTLGGFSVVRDGQPVSASGWQSKKARDLLKILVARRGHPIARPVLMEALWPDEDPAPLGNRLSVALATVRSVLDPSRRYPSDHYVVATPSLVRVDLDHLAVDIDQFVTDAHTALSDTGRSESDIDEALSAAEAQYAGDFLEEDPYADWAVPLREEARAAYIAVTRRLANRARAAGDHDQAIRYLLRILERDPYDEEAHLFVVSTFRAAGRHGEARRRYRVYVSAMRDIDVEAAPFPSPP